MTATTFACTIPGMRDIGDRITKAREVARLNQSELARLMSVTPQAVQKWEAGETVPRGQRIQKLATALGVSVAYLVSGDDSGDDESKGIRLVSDAQVLPFSGKTVVVPRLNISASMGHGLAQPDGYLEIIERMTVNADWVRQCLSVTNPNNLAIVTGRGDSMESTFKDGDLLLVDRGVNEISADAVYVMAIEGDLYVKRVQRQPGGKLLLISDNQRYQPMDIRPAELSSFHVLARVILVWSANRV